MFAFISRVPKIKMYTVLESLTLFLDCSRDLDIVHAYYTSGTRTPGRGSAAACVNSAHRQNCELDDSEVDEDISTKRRELPISADSATLARPRLTTVQISGT